MMKKEKKKLDVENAFGEVWVCSLCFGCTIGSIFVAVSMYFAPGAPPPIAE